MKIEIPEFVKACLWSYDIDTIDFSVLDHRTRVIQNVLNRGTSDAISWLRKIFSEKEYIYPVFDEHELLLLLDNIKDIKVLKIVNDYADDALIGFLSSLCD